MPSNKRTLLFTLEYPPQVGGVANYYGNMVRYWRDGSIEVLTGKKLLKPHWIFGLWHLWRAVKKHRIQTVLVGHILPLGTVTWLLHKVMNPASRVYGASFNYVVFLHGMDLTFALKSGRKRWLARRILAGAKKVICANSYVAGLAKKVVDEDKVVVVNPGIGRMQNAECRMQNYLIKKYNLEGKKILLQVGRLVKRKGYDKVLEAMKDVLRDFPELVYVIIGSGSEMQNSECRIQNAEMKDNAIIIPDASDEERDGWYELCDIFIMPSRTIGDDFEGFGIVYLEANLHGKPVIAGDSGGVRDAVEEGVNGLLVDPENVKEIGQAIVRLCKDDGLRARLGRQGRLRVEREFGWEKKVGEIERILNGY